MVYIHASMTDKIIINKNFGAACAISLKLNNSYFIEST